MADRGLAEIDPSIFAPAFDILQQSAALAMIE